MLSLTRIGYWRSEQQPELPDPHDVVDNEWTSDDRGVVSAYFRRGTTARAYMGPSFCRMCGVRNGSLEYTDGRFLWPDGFAHYIDEHNVKPPDAVIAWAVERMALIEDAEVDDDWWRGITARS